MADFSNISDEDLLESLGRDRLKGNKFAGISDEDLLASLQSTEIAPQPGFQEAPVGAQQAPPPAETQPLLDPFIQSLIQPGTGAPLPTIEQARQTRGGQDLVGPTIGETVGGLAGAGTGPAAPVMVPLLSSLGSVAGLNIERLLRGQPTPTAGEQIFEGVTTVLPEVGEQILRGGIKAVIKRSPRFAKQVDDHISRQLDTQIPEMFNPPTKQTVDNLYDQVRGAGVEAEGALFRPFLKPKVEGAPGGLTDGQFNIVKRELTKLGSTPSPDIEFGFGEAMFGKMKRIREGGFDQTFSLSELDTMSSQLKARVRDMGDKANPAVKDTLNNMIDNIENAIETKLVFGKGAEAAAVNTLKGQARQAALRRKMSNETGDLIRTKFISSGEVLPDGTRLLEFDTKGIHNTMRAPSSKAEQRLVKTLDKLGVKSQIMEFTNQMQLTAGKLKVAGSQGRIGQVSRFLGEVMVTREGRQRLANMIDSGGGTISFSGLALLANTIRRSVAPTTQAAPAVSGIFGAGPL